MNTSLQQEFRVIDAHQAFYRRMQATIDLLRIRLRIARGEFVGLRDRWRAKDIVGTYPDLKE